MCLFLKGSGGSLGRMLKLKKRFDENTARKYICQIILAIEALHDKMIIFRDLKPDNLVLDEKGNAYLIDFGLAKIGVYDDINRSFLGTPAYLSPEIVRKDVNFKKLIFFEIIFSQGSQ